MADLTDLQAAETVKIAGANTSGSESNFVDSTNAGALHVNLRNNAGTETGISTTPIRVDPTGTTTQPVSDAGGSLTVDGTVTANQGTSNTATNGWFAKITDGTDTVDVSANSELRSSDILQTAVVQGTVTVSVAGAAVELKVGGSTLTNRKSVKFQAQGTNVIYGYSSGSQPFLVANGETIAESLGPGISIWFDRSSGAGSVTIAIAEFS